MAELFNQLMSGFSPDQPLTYICYFLLVISTFGAFMRFLYTLIKPW